MKSWQYAFRNFTEIAWPQQLIDVKVRYRARPGDVHLDLPSPQVQRPRVKRASQTATYPVPQSKDTHDGHVTVQQLCQIASAIKCRCCGNVKVNKEDDEIPLAEAYHDSDHEEDKENASPVEQKPEDSNEEDNKTGNIEDLFVGQLWKKPWQYREYQSGNATWMAAAQRRHQHRRRTGEILGTASVDLSGPHEPTPMLGSHIC